jgi:3-oxoacyl-[acyl-carrier-protein] synthase III
VPHVSITATARYTPAQILDNEEVIRRCGLDVTPEWIEQRTGIRSRHWLEDHQTTSDMAVATAQRLLEARGVGPESIDRIILATISPDHPSPSTATIVARKLGARCAAFDVSAACAGFLYGLDLGVAAVRNGDRRVLVIAADARSRFIDKRDRRAAVLFADGAGGVLLEPSELPGVVATHVGAEGREKMGAHIPAGGASLPTSPETVRDGQHFLVVDPSRDIFDLFVRFTREACDKVLGRARMRLEDIDVFITHQGNARMVEMVAKDLGLRSDQIVDIVRDHGNTSGATVPIALAECVAQGRLRPGMRALLTSVGAGYTFGAAIVRF